MKRTTYKLTDEEAAIIDDLRYNKKWLKQQQSPTNWQNRPWCTTNHCHNKAAPVIGATLCTWCQKNKRCDYCDDSELVCENHPQLPWGGASNRKDACNCGAGMPCQSCDNADRRREIAMQQGS